MLNKANKTKICISYLTSCSGLHNNIFTEAYSLSENIIVYSTANELNNLLTPKDRLQLAINNYNINSN